MRIRANYHTHCSFCDGAAEPEAFVQAAIAQGLTALGFSSHAPLPFPNTFTMPADRLQEYALLIRGLQEKYRNRIEILLGLEVDYVPGVEAFQAPFAALGLDYSIGSVHYMDADAWGTPWPIDAEGFLFDEGIERIYRGNARAAVERYYALVREMIGNTRHDVLGHLDVIKKNNPGGRHFSEEAPWYRDAVEQTLTLAAASAMIVEVNTAGIRKRVGLYPSVPILKRCRELGIRLTLNSDAHVPADLLADYSEVQGLLRDIGYREIYLLESGAWKPAGL